MHRLFLPALALGLLLGASPVRSDEPPTPEKANERLQAQQRLQADVVRTLLASADDRSVAWGATWARALSLTMVEPELVGLLREEARDSQAVGYYGMLAVFDALIEFETRLEAEDLVPFLERPHGRGRDHEAAAVVLLAHSANPHARLAAFDVLDAREDSWEEAWTALGNLLQEAKTPGFALRLLRALDVELTITVTDHARISGRGRSRTLFGGRGDGRLPAREGYPAVWRHGLTFHARPGDVLLADGPRPVYRTRRLAERGFGTARSSQFRSRSRFEWIARILDTDLEDLPLSTAEFAVVHWSDAPAFHADVAIQRRAVEDAFLELVGLLDLGGAVTQAEARGLTPRIRVFVLDNRDDKSVPLPTVDDDVDER